MQDPRSDQRSSTQHLYAVRSRLGSLKTHDCTNTLTAQLNPHTSTDMSFARQTVSVINVSDNAQVHIGDSHTYHVHTEDSSLGYDPGALIVKSLQFPEMFSRYDGIKERRSGTYEWNIADTVADNPGIP